jgi:acyl carrier protein
MTDSDIENKIRELIAKQLDLPISKVINDKKFIEDLDADSLDTVEIIIAIEDEFNIEINDDNAEQIITVGDAIRQLKVAIFQLRD